MKKIVLFCILMLFFYTKIIAQNANPLPKLPDMVFADYFSNRLCTCAKPYFAGFSPKFMKLWKKIGKDFQQKKQADLTKFYAHLKTNEADATRYKDFSGITKELCEEDFATLEANYNFDWEEELSTYLSKNINIITNILHTNKQCSDIYVVWIFTYGNLVKQ